LGCTIFAGFFYDLKNDKKTEYLNVTGQTLADLNVSRTIDDKGLTYQTGKADVEFKVHEKEGLSVINNSEFYKDTYPIVGWKAEKWIAVNGNANKLTRLAFEMIRKTRRPSHQAKHGHLVMAMS